MLGVAGRAGAAAGAGADFSAGGGAIGAAATFFLGVTFFDTDALLAITFLAATFFFVVTFLAAAFLVAFFTVLLSSPAIEVRPLYLSLVSVLYGLLGLSDACRFG